MNPAQVGGRYPCLALLALAVAWQARALPQPPADQPAPDVAAAFHLIRSDLERKHTAEALRVAKDLSAQHKNDVNVHFSLGLLLAVEKQYHAAELELALADALQPSTFEIVYNLGLAYLRESNFPRAEVELQRALKLQPASVETLSLLAETLADQQRPMDALALLVQAHKTAPDNADVILLMAQISISQHYYEDAIPLLEAAVQSAPQRLDLRAALGESYLMSDRVDQSVAIFQPLVQLQPSARSYTFLGLGLQRLGRFDEAKQAFLQGLQLDPHSSECLFHLGLIAERQGDSAAAEARFKEVLRAHPDSSDAVLELANLRIAARRLPEAEELLKKYVQVSRNPATGYYKLAMVERSLHHTEAADADLKQFQTLSKNVEVGRYANEHLYDYLDTRAKLAPSARVELDIADLTEQLKSHPNQPQGLYLLAEAYLKSGNVAEAKSTIAQLDNAGSNDYRTIAGAGVLLARYRLYDEAIQQFRAALALNPGSDDVSFDIADAYYRKGQYADALNAAQQVSEQGRKDDAYLALLGDIYAHLGDTAGATDLLRNSIQRNPDNDQCYLALALLQFRESDIAGAQQTLLAGNARLPGSGKLLWGLGVAAALRGNTAEAGHDLEQAVEILPEWPGSYSTLGVFYFQTGQIEKAKEVLSRFKNSNPGGGLDINRIEKVLAQAQSTPVDADAPMTMASRKQLLGLALMLADKTL